LIQPEHIQSTKLMLQDKMTFTLLTK